MLFRSSLATLVAVLALLTTLTAVQPTRYRARLSTVPIDVAMQSTVAGRGTATATLSGRVLTVEGAFEGLKSPATTARLHVGAKGIRGPAVLDLTVSGDVAGTIAGRVELTAEQADDLRDSRIYLQLHSEKAPEGNLWGWFLPQVEPS